MAYAKDLKGQVFYNMKAIRRVGTDKHRHPIYLFECLLCGRKVEKVANEVKRGKCKSCGCNQNLATTTHGMTGTKMYHRWQGMIARCYRKTNSHYKSYGGRGIKVCERWRHSFENFLEDMGEPPFKDAQIDRIDNDKDYEPSNCRWATPLQNAHNKQKTKFKNITKYHNKYKVVIARNYKTYYLGLFESLEQAINARDEWINNFKNDIV